MKKAFRLELPPRTVPRRPYRDSALLYGSLAVVLVAAAAFTGGSLVRALVIGSLFFVAAMAWSWHRWRVRLREEDQRRT